MITLKVTTGNIFMNRDKEFYKKLRSPAKVRGERREARGEEICAIAQTLLNAPYLWGGKNAMGMDCSGFTQVVYAVFGVNLLRNAREQMTQGVLVPSLAVIHVISGFKAN